MSYRDADGRNGLQYIVQVASHLLSPSAGENTAAFVGRLITVLIKKAADQLGDCLDQLLRAVLSKLQGAESIVVIESLLMVYAHLVHSQLDGVLSFLSSVPGPTGQSALSFVLSQWCSKQPVFYGSYERKISAVALAKLLEHGVTTNDSRLSNILVPGDQIFTPDERRLTRSMTATKVEQWTEVPVLVKVFKLIIYELSNTIDANMGKDDVTESDEEDGWEDEDDCPNNLENGEDGHSSVILPSYNFPDFDMDAVDGGEDPDAVS